MYNSWSLSALPVYWTLFVVSYVNTSPSITSKSFVSELMSLIEHATAATKDLLTKQ